jgi:hypothetical protein
LVVDDDVESCDLNYRQLTGSNQLLVLKLDTPISMQDSAYQSNRYTLKTIGTKRDEERN